MKRNFLISGLFSLLLPGLGQLYNGQLKKGLYIFIISEIIAWVIVPLFNLYYSFNGLLSVLIIQLSIHLFALSEAVFVSLKLKEYSLKSYNKGYIYFSILTVFLFISFLVDYNQYLGTRSFTIPTSSMEPTLYAGDFILSDVGYYKSNDPQGGELIIYMDPLNPEIYSIKRCVAIAGQTLEIINKELFVNGRPVAESEYVKYIDHNVYPKDSTHMKVFMDLGSRDNFGPVIIPEDHFFFLGDNRDNSMDSRFMGFIAKENLYARPLYVYFSWDNRSSSLFNRIHFDRIGLKLK